MLSYVVSILEEMGSDFEDQSASEEAFDVDGFCEMMTAYFPEFSVIEPGSVCTWIFELASSLSSKKRTSEPIPNIAWNIRAHQNVHISDPIREFSMAEFPTILPQISSSTSDSRGSSQSSDLGCDKEPISEKRVHHLSETSEGSSDSGDYLPSQEVCTPFNFKFILKTIFLHGSF